MGGMATDSHVIECPMTPPKLVESKKNDSYDLLSQVHIIIP